MLSTHHAVDFSYTRPEQEVLFRVAREQDVDQGGRYDARSATIILWSHYWLDRATFEESAIIGTFYFRWDEPQLWQIETEDGFSLEDLLQELGRLEMKALGVVKHGDLPPTSEG
jgi:hypothetical protein